MPADPVVSPADTIRAALEAVDGDHDELITQGWSYNLQPAIAALDALLAVGERDKAEIEALTAAVEGLLEVETRSRRGDPSLEAEEWYAIRDYAQKVLKDDGIAAALKESRERDRQRIAQLTDLFKPEPFEGVRFNLVCASCGGRGEVPGRNHDDPRWMHCLTCDGDGLSARARAVLADKEDAG